MKKINYCYMEFRAAGLSFAQVDGVEVWGPDEATCNQWLDAWDGKATTIAKVKAEANAKILALAPDWKQRNLIAGAVELERIERLTGVTPETTAKLAAIQLVWTQVGEIRAASDAIEAAILALATWQAVVTFDYSAMWP